MATRVLLADSDTFLLDFYREGLQQRGFDVRQARNGLECLETLRLFVPDVLVLEPSIPWGGGDGVLALMHDDAGVPVVPVIVLTHGRDPGMLYRLAPFEVDDYQVKPLSVARLAMQIRAVAARRQLCWNIP
jgi:DNA-binding response OmpR family regulator